MDLPLTNEKPLLADIDRLREQFLQTQDLYREVCVLLFFRYGITPTANKLYQLVRKGSMSAPAEALNKFWEDLRDKSRVRIEHPDLPDALKTAAGELTATLWATAQGEANESLASFRSEAQAAVVEAKVVLAEVEIDREAIRLAFTKTQQALDQANIRLGTLDQQLTAVGATNAALEAQLQQAKTDNDAHQQRLADARRDFTAELDKLRATAQLADERFRVAETRALLEIDRERTATAKLRKELDCARVSANQAADRHRSEIATLQGKVGDLRQKTGILEGNLQAVTANRDLALGELKAAQAQLADAVTQLSVARSEAQTSRQQAEQAQQLIAQLRETGKPVRALRRPKVN